MEKQERLTHLHRAFNSSTVVKQHEMTTIEFISRPLNERARKENAFAIKEQESL